MDIQWTDTDPQTGERRYLRAERFARKWRFFSKPLRRGEWAGGLVPTRAMWEHVLDSLLRRYRRREGVSDADVAQVQKVLKEWRDPVSDEEE